MMNVLILHLFYKQNEDVDDAHVVFHAFYKQNDDVDDEHVDFTFLS